MKLEFRIDWGYQYLYSRRHYHPVYIWDGHLECKKGEIIESYLLDYKAPWYGPAMCAKETRLEKPRWQSRTKRAIAGARFVAEVSDDAVFHLKMASFDLTFTAKELNESGRIDIHVGPKYLNGAVIITKKDYLWFRPEPEYPEFSFDIEKLGVPVYDWFRMKLAWLDPGKELTWKADIKESRADYCEQLLHIAAMGLPEKYPEDCNEIPVDATITLELLCDGEKVQQFTRFYRFHDDTCQMLEDDWTRFKVPAGRHTFTLKNITGDCGIGISKLTLKPCEYAHGQLSIPEWALKGEKMWGKVFAVKADTLKISYAAEKLSLDCKEGWNEFEFCINKGGKTKFKCLKNTADIEIYDIPEEKVPVKVGYDMTVVPHDANGYMDWLLDYTYRTRLGNYIVFRAHTHGVNLPCEEDFIRWGKFCKKHGVYVSESAEVMPDKLAESAGEMFHDCGRHEYPGVVYALDPAARDFEDPGFAWGVDLTVLGCDDMKEAYEKFIKFLKDKIDKTKKICPRVAFGDASGGVRHSFLAGVGFVRAETMVGHTMTLLSHTRPSAEALGEGLWGVHIAVHHNHQVFHENHLGLYFLSLMQPWIMGADTIYEEDSLFELFKEERQTWDDLLTKGKRDMTRSFFKFVKTHPRSGKCARNIAFLEGRYAAPFNGFICGPEQDPHYSVWGVFGNDDASWGHGQPEKCRQLLDVLMPGASTHPLRQKFDKRRMFFSGTPYGDFDCIPVEANADYFKNYKLIMNLGWNTAIDEDTDKLRDFVKNGGTLLTGITQFSTHVKRQFLKDMEDLSLVNGGDLSDFCGIKVLGRGEEYCGQYNCKGRENMPEPQLSAMPSDSSEEDGKAYMADIELCGAEIIAWDSATGLPLLVRNKYGEGYVYTFTIWAYPGHEKFQSFSAAWVAKLSSESLNEIYVEDASGEVFWTIWKDGKNTKVFMLNTDWSLKDNVKTVSLINGDEEIAVDIPERTLVCAEISDSTNIICYTL